ncbi:MAG TPA: nickel pincer cofactor biosynthesis protein LarC [Terriglobales bacterium]|nr:nickel pincer cofactor biosynthesis protein LarC [Terriglobales bacterium]
MRIAYLECFSGISGDMFLGALVDAGVSPETLEEAVRALNLGARLEVKKVMRSGIAAIKVDVWVGDEKEGPAEDHQHHHSHEHAHGHDHAHKHSHSLDDAHHHEHSHGRSLNDIRKIISSATINDSAKQQALAIFQALGEAEAKIHNTTIEKIHFHEVGAVDAIVDIVCAAVGSEALGVDAWICSPINVGSGTVQCAHGRLPVPVPAVVEMLKGVPVYSSGIEKELTTPTGAAIVKTLASRFGTAAYKIEKSGYGAGSRDMPGQPNVLRITVGESGVDSHAATPETISVLEANLDDLNPQVFGYVMDRLFDSGALDVFGTPVQMKKGRPGMLLTVLARTEDTQKLTKIIFAETTTLGIRMREERREILTRRAMSVKTQWGEVRMKVANLNGTVTNYAPEYEDCRRIASEKGVPLKAVMQEAIKVYLDQQNG